MCSIAGYYTTKENYWEIWGYLPRFTALSKKELLKKVVRVCRNHTKTKLLSGGEYHIRFKTYRSAEKHKKP